MLGKLVGGLIKLPDCGTCSVMFGENEDGWEHVSVSPKHKYKMPTWDDMCVLKDIFSMMKKRYTRYIQRNHSM